MAAHQAVYATDEVVPLIFDHCFCLLSPFCSTVVHLLSSGSRLKRHAHMASRRSRSAPVVFRSARVQTSHSRTYWPRRQWPTLFARLLAREVALVAVYANRTSSIR